MGGSDVLVLGAGSAGCVVASRLSEDRALSVHLVEAGAWPTDPDIADPLRWPLLEGRSFDWAYRTVPQPGTAGRAHVWPRGRAVGGSSCMHAMAHVEGHEEDFAPWAEAGGARWSYAALAPAFRRCALPRYQPTHEVSPLTRAFMAAGRAIGAPGLASHSAKALAGVTANTLTIHDGRRVSAADAYLRSCDHRPNLIVSPGVQIERLVFDGYRVDGVLARDAGGEGVLRADTVVVCLGAVAAPLLLLRSGIGDPAELAAAGVRCVRDVKQTGRNLHDHLFAAGNLYAASRPVPPSRLQHSESLMYLHSDDPTRADGAPDCVLACVLLPAVSECFTRPATGSAYTILCGFTHPTSRGTIRLGGPFLADAPLIDPAYLGSVADRRAFRASLRLARQVGHGAALADWRDRELLPGGGLDTDDELDAFLGRAAITHHHPVGTCAMGAVVDSKLRVSGVDNLFVVDASIIPSITTGPVNAAVTAIAESWSEAYMQQSQARTEMVQ